MKPEIVLNMRSFSDPEKLRDEWLAEYAKHEADHMERVALLKERVRKAYDLVAAGKPEDDPALNGDFPLGKPEDAELMCPFFTVPDLVLFQLGLAEQVKEGHYVEPAYDVLARNGIRAEWMGDYEKAYVCYYSCPSPALMARARYCLELQKNSEEENK